MPADHAFAWDALVDAAAAERGSLAALALHLAERRAFAEDVESVERGLRRLRGRGTAPGGVWGDRLLAVVGLPAAVADRVRWMGQYHTRFTDLPVSLGAELLRPWDRPPVSESPARIWVLLGHASLAIRRRADARPLLHQAGLLAARAEPAAQIELALVQSYVESRGAPAAGAAALARAEALLATADLAPDDRACLHARAVDQRAWPLNRVAPTDHAAAAALYATLPADGPPFARCRRENGLGWSRLCLGEQAAALAHARASVEAAGDGGSLRLRAMALNLLAHAATGAEAEAARGRARAIALRLEDEALRVRFGGPVSG
ncbi:MAG: hypothetical protein H6706_04935 [Myxococcales bacterium]|nr:hypothetical protein [Myxococcales bacterium]